MEFKPKQPVPFTILVDTREQSPWVFPDNVLTVTASKLKSGDYSIVGYENIVAIERKTLNDLVNTIVHGRTRFQKELKRLECVAYRCVAIEANVSDIVDGNYNSDASPNSIIGSILSFERYHGIPFCFWGNRQIAEHMALRWFRHVWKLIGE